MKIDNQEIIKDAIAEFETNFSNSDFWDLSNYPKNYNSIKKFVIKCIKQTEEKTKDFCIEQYNERLS